MRRQARHGGGMIDMFVAFTLLITAMAVTLPIVVRHGRLLQSQRHYRVALDELTNQLDRLTAIEDGDLSEALDQLEVSEFAAQRLSGAEISGDLQPAETGERITLRLIWNEPGRRESPLVLAGWRFSDSGPTAPAEGGRP
jgi:hypothetical protein